MRRKDPRRNGVAVAALLTAALAGGCSGAKTSEPSPSTLDSAEAKSSAALSPRFTRPRPGTKSDIRIESSGTRGRWTGPWPNDIAGVDFTFGDRWVVVKLRFSRLSPETATGSGGDEFYVWLDAPGPQRFGWPADRGIVVFWGLSDRWLQKPCEFKPDVRRAGRTIIFRGRRSCVDELDRIRASASMISRRLYSNLPRYRRSWWASDDMRWTAFADPGETVSIKDPAS